VTDSFDEIARRALARMTADEHRELLRTLTGLGSRSVDTALDTMFGQREPELRPVPKKLRGFRMRLALAGTKPPVWRRIDVPGDITLDRLHQVIQAAMGWLDSHLHQFSTGSDPRAPHFLTRYDIDGEGDEGIDEGEVRLDQVVAAKGDRLWYEYDFGDGWRHTLAVEAVLDTPPAVPTVVAGKRACPPEDCGGTWGYAELAKWVRSGYDASAVPEQFESAADARQWLPLDWDPDQFDVSEAQQMLDRALAPEVPLPGELLLTKQGLDLRGFSTLDELVRSAAALDVGGRRGPGGVPEPTEEQAAMAVAPFVTLLDAIGPGVQLTAAGYLPPAVVTEVATRSGIADWWIGKINREDQTYPVQQLRGAARALGLVRVRKGVLAPAAVVRRYAGDALALLRHIAERVPLGSSRFDRQAGWVSVAVVAAEVEPVRWNDAVRAILSEIGWRTTYDRVPALLHVGNPTLDTFDVLSGAVTRRCADPSLAAIAALTARAAMFHRPESDD